MTYLYAAGQDGGSKKRWAVAACAVMAVVMPSGRDVQLHTALQQLMMLKQQGLAVQQDLIVVDSRR